MVNTKTNQKSTYLEGLQLLLEGFLVTVGGIIVTVGAGGGGCVVLRNRIVIAFISSATHLIDKKLNKRALLLL